MDLYCWRYEVRKISDNLNGQMLSIMQILNDPSQVNNRTWGGSLQEYIGERLGISAGQVRTIKRMMEEVNILIPGALNSQTVPCRETIYTEEGLMLLELFSIETLLQSNRSPRELMQIQEIRNIYRLHYQNVFVGYSFENDEGEILHPLRATLKAVRQFGYLDYWEWYILNTIITKDDCEEDEARLEEVIRSYREGELRFTFEDIKENTLSHVYILGNFASAGFFRIEGRKPDLRAYIESSVADLVDRILAS